MAATRLNLKVRPWLIRLLIHPFYDGNGRTGRILLILFLRFAGLLDQPVLFLSRYILSRKSDYYRLLREVTEQQS